MIVWKLTGNRNYTPLNKALPERGNLCRKI